MFLGQHQAGRERLAKPVLERLDRSDPFFGHQFPGFVLGQRMAGDVFFQPERAFLVATFKQAVGLPVHLVLAFRAGRQQVGKRTIDDLFGVGPRLVDNPAGQFAEFVHELVTSQSAVFHFLQLVFPFTGQLR